MLLLNATELKNCLPAISFWTESLSKIQIVEIGGGKRVPLIQYVEAGGKPSTWFPPGWLVEQIHPKTKPATTFFAGWIVRSLFCLFVCFGGWLVGWLAGWLVLFLLFRLIWLTWLFHFVLLFCRVCVCCLILMIFNCFVVSVCRWSGLVGELISWFDRLNIYLIPRSMIGLMCRCRVCLVSCVYVCADG